MIFFLGFGCGVISCFIVIAAMFFHANRARKKPKKQIISQAYKGGGL